MERLPTVMMPLSRRTTRLTELHRHIGLALGGEGGARLAARLAIPISGDTLLRLLTTGFGSQTAKPAPRILGIDDWAWRRGHRYGTVLVDLESNNVIDLLPDREAATVGRWLQEHPGVEIVARDRSGAYADGVRQGAPDAIQVADRWHLLRNLGVAVQGLADKHHAAIARAARHVTAEFLARAAPVDTELSPARQPKPTTAEQVSAASRARRQTRYEEAARLKAAGLSITRIAEQLGTERKTVRRWLQLGHAPLWKSPQRASMLEPFVGFLTSRWDEGCHNASRLWRELVAIGFPGRPSIVHEWASARRHLGTSKDATRVTARPPVWPAPQGYRLARLLMADASRLTAEEELFRAYLFAEEPALHVAIEWAQQFNALIRRQTNGDLDQLLVAADRTMLARFAGGLRRDAKAIRAALELPWTTSPVEGQISRLKMLKRTMYGRAGMNLLRARLLHAA